MYHNTGTLQGVIEESSEMSVTAGKRKCCRKRVTGNGTNLISQKTHIYITAATVGKIVDFGVKDSMNMGACMAPADDRIGLYQGNGDT